MEDPILKLTVEKGPRNGETRECKPKSTIRIGRVVKGNNFPIKDQGISSNHLLIEFKQGKWVVSDLDTSNGTFLNGTLIDGMKPYGLKSGDVIKIGELTSLVVKIGGDEDDEEEAEEEVKRGKSGLRKTGKKGTVEVEIDEKEEEKNGKKGAKKPGKKGSVAVEDEEEEEKIAKKIGKYVSFEVEDEEEEEEEEEVKKGRRGLKKNGKKGCEVVEVEEEEESKQMGRNKGKVTRATTKGKSAKTNLGNDPKAGEKVNLGLESCGEQENVGALAAKLPPNTPARVTRAAAAKAAVGISKTQKVEKAGENSNLGEEENVGGLARNKPRRGATRVTRSTKVEAQKVVEGKELDEVVPVVERRTRRGAAKRTTDSKEEPVVPITSERSNVGDKEPEIVIPVEEKQAEEVGSSSVKASESVQVQVSEAPVVPGPSNFPKGTCDELNANKNPAIANDEKDASRIDPEKMTLGEWFDYLEVYLPKQINETSDEIISSMRERAKQFKEFLMEQKDVKGKSPVS